MEKFMKALMMRPDGRVMLENVEVPIPEASQVLIKVHVTSITPQDIEVLSKGCSFPTIIGVEGSGIVVQDSKSLFTRKYKGKKVAFMQLDQSLPGSWAEYVICDEKYFVGLNENIDFLRGATLMINPLTVLMMNERVKKSKHKSVIHSNAGSDLGIVFIKWCHFSSIPVISIVNTQEEAEKISSVTPDYILIRKNPTFLEDLKKICAEVKPTCGFDFSGGEAAGDIFNCLQDNGELFLITASESQVDGLSAEEFIFKGKSLKGLRLKAWFDELSVIKRNKYYNLIQKIHFVFNSTLTNVYPINQFKEGIENYKPFGENLFHFACDLHGESSNKQNSIFNQYIKDSLKQKIDSLPGIEWNGLEYPIKVLTEGIYKGEVVNDKPTGVGILIGQDEYYFGSFENGMKNGHGRLVKEEFWYEGEFKNGLFEGLGILKLFDGGEERGRFVRGEIQGKGDEEGKSLEEQEDRKEGAGKEESDKEEDKKRDELVNEGLGDEINNG